MGGVAEEEPSSVPCEVFKTEIPDAAAKDAEAKRLRETFKYFSAICGALDLVDNYNQSKRPYNPDSVRISPDPVLNSLAQLGAIRLRTHRAIISLIDAEYQYIVAESTQSLSLYDADHHDPGDKLCIGTRPLDLTSGICAGTVHVFHDDSKRGTCISTSNIYADRSRYVINDLSKESIYKDRPYVKGFPHMRYYAEVPIKTASGHVIGTYSVYHHAPREGLSEEDYSILTELASATMRYLEKIKVEDDHAQASRLLRGLNSFVQQDDSPNATAFKVHRRKRELLEPSPDPSAHRNKRHRASSLISSRGSGQILTAASNDLHSEQRSRLSSPSLAEPSFTPSPDVTPGPREIQKPSVFVDDTALDHQSPLAVDKSKETTPATTATKDQTDAELRDAVIPNEVRETFSRASHILRKAMDLDGVIFIDAASSNFASSVEMHLPSSPMASLNAFDSDDDSFNASDDDAPTSPRSGRREKSKERQSRNLRPRQDSSNATGRPLYRMSGMLGHSSNPASQARDAAGPPDRYSLPEDVHQSLLRFYPKGHIFNFGPERRPSQSNGSIPRAHEARGAYPPRQKPIRRRDLERIIRFFFPNARSAIFMPLWNPHKESWFAGSIGWTTDEKRVLQRGDFAYFSVFGNSIMAEVTRLELIASVQAKSDFISSISHELRSPLHGILGSAELLRESDTNSNQKQLIAMVENCGRTLLDTMDHILDFAKINSNPSKRHRYKGGAIDSSDLLSSGGVFEDLSIFDISRLVEEIAESLIAAHRYSNPLARRLSGHDETQTYASLLESSSSSKPNDASPVTVILNIDQNSAVQICSEATAWRRILLNLLGNALKYTSAGFVEVMLRTTTTKEAKSANAAQDKVTLVITDTGRGIGKAYLQSHLYTPFIQENNLSSGTGLGLSIVQKMVSGLGGTLDIQSEIGVGTRVTVAMPVKPAPDSNREQMPVHQQQDAVICLVGFEKAMNSETSPSSGLSTETKHTNALQHSLAIHSKDWLGVRVISATNIASADADIIVIPEEKLHLLSVDDGPAGAVIKVPRSLSLVVISSKYTVAHQLRSPTPNRIQYLFQPFGPRRIVEILTLAMDADRSEIAYGVEESSIAGDGTSRATSVDEGISRQDMQPQPHSPPGSAVMQDVSDESVHKPYVLAVEDNDVNLNILVSYIRKLGYDCATAVNGQEAFDVFTKATRPFDYILMDVSMPVMDGFAATRKIRDFERHEGRQPTPIVALTGLGSTGAQHEAFTSGMNMFFTKPVSMKKIKALVEGGVEALQQ